MLVAAAENRSATACESGMGFAPTIKEWAVKKYVYGYSIRTLDIDSDWTQKRREEFLLIPDVEVPKSVDSNVWQEISSQMVETNFGKMPLPQWGDREKMLLSCDYRPSMTDMAELTIIVFVDDDEIPPEYIVANDIEPIESCAGHFIGYDIADEGLTSSVSNCGYSEAEIVFAKSNYAEKINKHGLFDDLLVANSFLEYSLRRVPEHSPFYVYGLFLDKEI